MKDLTLTPGKEATFYFSIVGILCFISLYVFPNEFETWLMINFCIYGMLATICIAKGIGALRKVGKH